MAPTEITKEQFEEVLGLQITDLQWMYILTMNNREGSPWYTQHDIMKKRQKTQSFPGQRLKLVVIDEFKAWNYNPYTAMDEEGRWWLIGLPGGPRPLLGPETKEQAHGR